MNALDNKWWSPLQYAMEGNTEQHYEVMKHLKQAGAITDTRALEGIEAWEIGSVPRSNSIT